MTWKSAAQRAVKKEMQPMRQATHWVLFLSVAIAATCITLSSASAASAELIELNPEIANSSWLTQ
jgi:hypothetical protein